MNCLCFNVLIFEFGMKLLGRREHNIFRRLFLLIESNAIDLKKEAQVSCHESSLSHFIFKLITYNDENERE